MSGQPPESTGGFCDQCRWQCFDPKPLAVHTYSGRRLGTAWVCGNCYFEQLKEPGNLAVVVVAIGRVEAKGDASRGADNTLVAEEK